MASFDGITSVDYCEASDNFAVSTLDGHVYVLNRSLQTIKEISMHECVNFVVIVP